MAFLAPSRMILFLMMAGLALSAPLSAALAQSAPPVLPINQAYRAFAITPSDSVNLPNGITLGIFNGNATACNAQITLANDAAPVTWANIQSGSLLPIRALRVWSTSTTCTNLIAMYGQ